MIIAVAFFILMVAVLSAWQGKRNLSITLFAISFILAVGFFYHHVTTVIGLSL